MVNAPIYTLKHFRFWCQKVLPLVYDDSLSYYEVLTKVVDYLNNVISDVNNVVEDVEELQSELNVVQQWINDFDTSYAEKIIEEYLAKMIYVGISDKGYIVYYIPKSWNSIKFKTTGYDYQTELMPEYGHLVLQY